MRTSKVRLAILAAFATAAIAFGFLQLPTAQGQEGSRFEMHSPFLVLGPGYETTVALNNSIASDIPFRLEVFDAGGEQIASSEHTAEGNGVARIPLDPLLPRHFRGAGYVVLSCPREFLGRLPAQIVQINARRGTAISSLFVGGNSGARRDRRAPFWLPTPPSDAHILLLNRSSEVVNATLSVRSESKTAERSLTLEPGQLRRLGLRKAAGLHGKERFGALRIAHSGGHGDLIVRGFVLDESRGFSSQLDFVATPPELEESDMSGWSALSIPALRVGKSRQGKHFSPFLVLSNEMPFPVTVRANAHVSEPLPVAAGSKVPMFDDLLLGPHEATVLSLADSFWDALGREFGSREMIHGGLELEYGGPPGAVTASLLSVDEDFGNVHQSKAVWPSDLNLGYSYPMLLQGGWTTKVYLTNRTSERVVFCLFIHSEGESYTYAGVKWLEPFEFRMVDVGLLQAQQIPDEFGRVLPLTAEAGQIKLLVHSEDPSSVSGQAVLENRALGVSMPAGCPVCPASSENLFLLTSLAGVPNAFGTSALYIGDAGLESRIYAVETFDDSNWKDVSGFAGYNSSDDDVASVDKDFLRADVEFHSAGEADIGASFLGTGWLPPTLCEFLPSGGMNCSCTETAKPLSVPGSSSSGFFSPEAEVQVIPCTVSRVEYMDPDSGWTSAPSTLFVHKGTQVDFRAIRAEPAGWPGGKPTWGGTAGASGSGPSQMITLNANGDKTVTASCDNTVTANLKVYDLEGMLTPVDNFQGRSIMKYGIMEQVDLSFSTTPADVTASQIGGLQWKKTSGAGALTNQQDGTSRYTAPDTADSNLELKLEILAGPSKGRGPTFDRTVVVPSGAYLKQTPGTGIRHTMGKAGVGFAGTPYLEPKDVSFAEIQVREGQATADATGFLSADDNKEHPPSAARMVGSCTVQNGCQVETTDFVDSGDWSPNLPPEPWSAGTFTWEIPLEYRNSQDNWVEFATWTHLATIDSNGKMTISKGGLSFSRNWFDPTSSF
ncbi:MAG TPA: hypothetical protein VLU25_09700 [Acidobacteriota bacterium]|nr:hypothetical protein [Acidobacteriota bacterium]